MKKLTLVSILTLVPATLLAQSSMSATATAQASAEARVPASFSAGGKTELEATYARARAHDVPQAPIEHRVAEGRAKGASEAAILASSSRVETNMEAAQHAMIKAGHHPSDAEVESGAYAMERGVTAGQIEAMTRSAPSGRSLDVAFSVLTRLNEGGMPVNTALAQVQAKLDANASDASIASLTAKSKGVVKLGGGI
jgi:hypothetical protein